MEKNPSPLLVLPVVYILQDEFFPYKIFFFFFLLRVCFFPFFILEIGRNFLLLSCLHCSQVFSLKMKCPRYPPTSHTSPDHVNFFFFFSIVFFPTTKERRKPSTVKCCLRLDYGLDFIECHLLGEEKIRKK